MIELDPHHFQNIKLGVHIAQAAFIFVAWAIEIAVFKAKDSKIDGRPGWFFGLCFLTIPALIYLTMTPRFPRTRKFANPYAMASVDGFYCVLWLSAFAAVANWNSSGKCGDACKLSKAVVGLGVFIWLFFILTTFLSLHAVFFYKREGYLPGASRAPMNATQIIDPDKDAFSTAPHDDEYIAVHNTDEHDLHDATHASYDPPTYGGSGVGAGYTGGYVPPSVSDDTGYTGYAGAQGQQGADGRVHYPDARYDHV